MDPEVRRKQIHDCKIEQRSSIHLLRMMGSNKIEILLSSKVPLYSTSLKLAQIPRPDFIMMKEAILCFDKITQYQSENGDKQRVKETDLNYLTQMMAQVIRTFGTEDSEWYCATQTVLNSLFNLKSSFTHEQAKTFIDSIMKNFG